MSSAETSEPVLRLMAALEFSVDELTLNRTGRVSDRQRAGLERSRSWTRRGNVVMLGVLVAFVVVAVGVMSSRATQTRGSGSSAVLPAVVATVALVVLIGLGSARRSVRAAARRASGLVSRVEGTAKTRVVKLHANVADVAAGGFSYGGGVRHEVTVGDKTFIVPSQRVLDAFQPGNRYVAYYAGDDRFASLLSAEPTT